MKENKTTVSICGFWFHINWEADGKVGYDQRGFQWINKEQPECTNKEVVDICLDGYADLMKLKNDKK